MMNHIVPEFEENELDENYSIRELRKQSTMGGDEDIMELIWQNGQLVMQSQNQRSGGNKKSEARIRSSTVAGDETGIGTTTGAPDLFMQEDEMSSWLHYPMEENSLEGCLYNNNDLLYPTPPSSSTPTTAASLPPPPPPSVLIPSSRPPVPPVKRSELESKQPKYTNFSHFSRPGKSRVLQLGESSSSKLLKPSTVMESNETPVAVEEAPESGASRVSDKPPPPANIGTVVAGTSSSGREMETCDLSVTSSPGTGGSGGSGSVEPSSLVAPPPPPSDDRKRKVRDNDEKECHSGEDEYQDAKKQSHGATSSKRSRAAEVHNLSERRRRDRINEKMKALQELIPRCNKSDKASMLDEAIEYLKSLQMQVQMMSMGCSMVPMMFPGVQQYIPQMAMGMGMDMTGMNRPILPYPAMLPPSSMPNPAAAAAAVAAAAHLGQQRFPVPGFNISPQPVPTSATTGVATSQPVNLSAPMMNSFPMPSQTQPQVSSFANPFQQYLGLHQTQLPLSQNQGGGISPVVTKASSSKDPTNPDHS